MGKLLSKLLAMTLSLAMIITGFGWLGGISAYAAEEHTTLSIQVKDQNDKAMSGLDLTLKCYLPDEESGELVPDESFDIDIENKTGEDGLVSEDISELELWPDATYELIIDSTEEYQYEPVKITFGQTSSYTFFVDKVDGKDYTGEAVVLSVVAPHKHQLKRVEAVPATCTEDGTKAYFICEDETCGKIFANEMAVKELSPEELVVKALGHKWSIEVTKEPTKEEPGEAKYVCANDPTHEKTETITYDWEASDFTYEEWSGETSKEIYPGNDQGKYLTDTLWVVSGLSDTGKAKVLFNHDLIIPEKDPDGKQVQGVGNAAFKGLNLESVKFPEGVMTSENIYNGDAWKDIANRELTERGSFVIGTQAFMTNNITEVEFPEGVLAICQAAFNGNKLTKVKFPSTLMLIGAQAFISNTSKTANQIKKVYFPSKTDFRLCIRNQAFMYCAIQEAVLPEDTLQVFGHATNKASAFTGNPGKEQVTAADANRTEKLGGVVYLYMKVSDGVNTDLIAHDQNASLKNYTNRLITDPSEVMQAKLRNIPDGADLSVYEEILEEYNSLTEEEKAALPDAAKAGIEAAEAKKEADEAKKEAAEAKQEAAEKAAAVVNLANDVLDAVLIDKSLYNTASVTAFTDAFDAAQAALKNSEATTEDLNKADADLKAAKEGLVKKAANTMKVSAKTKTVKFSKVKKAKQTVTALTVKNPKGKVSYKKSSGKSNFTVSSKTGKITVKKGTKKGTYTIKVKVTAAGNGDFKSLSKTVKVTIKVK